MDKNFGKDFTQGSIVRHLIFFALPILLSSLVTTGYSIINAIWVGNLLGSNAMGAATVSFPVNVLMYAFVSGFTMALSVLVARHYGQGEYEQMQKVVNNCWTVGYLFILLIIALGFTFSSQIITFLGTPAPIHKMAAGYLRIMFLEFIFTYIAAVIASALQGIGNSVTPMIFMIAGTVLNAVFDPLLIIGVGPFPKLGLNGAAFASLIASAVTTIVSVIYMYTKYRGKPVTFKKFAFDRKILASVLQIGFPSFVQNALFSVSSAFMIYFVNRFGENAISGFGIATRIESIAILPGMAVMTAIATLTAQHFGANKVGRIKDIFRWGAVLNASMVFVIAGLILVFARPLVGLFVSNKAVIGIGAGYFHFVAATYVLLSVAFAANGVLNGSGKTILTMCIEFLTLYVVRIPLASVLIKTSLGVQGIWAAIGLSIVIQTAASLTCYFSGIWKKKKSEPEEEPVLTDCPEEIG